MWGWWWRGGWCTENTHINSVIFLPTWSTLNLITQRLPDKLQPRPARPVCTIPKWQCPEGGSRQGTGPRKETTDTWTQPWIKELKEKNRCLKGWCWDNGAIWLWTEQRRQLLGFPLRDDLMVVTPKACVPGSCLLRVDVAQQNKRGQEQSVNLGRGSCSLHHSCYSAQGSNGFLNCKWEVICSDSEWQTCPNSSWADGTLHIPASVCVSRADFWARHRTPRERTNSYLQTDLRCPLTRGYRKAPGFFHVSV